MANPLEQSIAFAVRSNHEMDRLFAEIGTADHPRGRIVSLYRNSRRAMATAHRGGRWDVGAARDVMLNLERSVREAATLSLLAGRSIGLRNARAQLGAYGIEPVVVSDSVAAGALNAIVAGVQRQTAQAIALVDSGAETAVVLGDDRRVGVFSYGSTAADTADWSARESETVFAAMLIAALAGSKQKFQKQAIAALDRRTTRTCIRVHGQVANLNSNFHLTEEPRYADWLPWPPFHRWCRTAAVLYLAEFDIGLTDILLAEGEVFWAQVRR